MQILLTSDLSLKIYVNVMDEPNSNIANYAQKVKLVFLFSTFHFYASLQKNAKISVNIAKKTLIYNRSNVKWKHM